MGRSSPSCLHFYHDRPERTLGLLARYGRPEVHQKTLVVMKLKKRRILPFRRSPGREKPVPDPDRTSSVAVMVGTCSSD
jgi:hypothetical protein